MGNARKNIILLGVLAFVLVVGAVAGIFMVNRNTSQKFYLEKLEVASKYLAAEDYDNAILTLEGLIQKEPEREEAYSQLAGVYVKQGNYTQATSVLQLGIKRTGSSNMKTMIQSVSLQVNSSADSLEQIGRKEGENGATESPNLKSQVNLLVAEFREYSAKDYEVRFGKGTAVSVEPEKIIKVNYERLDADVFYQNTGNSNTFHPKNLDVYETSHPYRIVFHSLESWLSGISYPASLDTMESIIGIRPLISDNAEHGSKQLEFTYRFCRCLVECDNNGTVASVDAWSEIYLDGSAAEEGNTFQGQIINARTGQGVENAQVTFRSEKGREVSATTDRQGYYEVNIEEGNFVIEVEADGFQSEEFERTILDLKDSEEGILIITPTVGENEVVIVLEWGASPRDLDSILQCDDFQIDYINRQDSNSIMKAKLDVDEIHGYGPETITVELKGDADFIYLVNNFNNEPDFAGCGATVKVYVNGQAPVLYTIPSTGNGTKVWEVFRYHNGEITAVNEIYDVTDINNVNK